MSSTGLPFRKVHVSRSASCTKLKNATRRNTPLEKRTRTLIGMVLLFLALLFLLVLVLMVLVPEPRGSGWRIHCGVEVTESSTNIQHTLSFGSKAGVPNCCLFLTAAKSRYAVRFCPLLGSRGVMMMPFICPYRNKKLETLIMFG